MTDRELLELAAKAAGLDLTGAYGEAGGALFLFYREVPDGPPFSWAPLDDDGDALRLAVALRMSLQFTAYYAVAYAGSPAAKQFTEQATMGYSIDEATRRAIVRAAAEIGARLK